MQFKRTEKKNENQPNFAVLSDQRVKLKESEKRNERLNLVR